MLSVAGQTGLGSNRAAGGIHHVGNHNHGCHHWPDPGHCDANLVKAREKAQRTACIANLKKLSHVKELWAFEKNKSQTAVPNPSDMTPYLGGGKMPSCPANGSYTLGRVSRTPVCSLADLGHDTGDSDAEDHHAQD